MQMQYACYSRSFVLPSAWRGIRFLFLSNARASSGLAVGPLGTNLALEEAHHLPERKRGTSTDMRSVAKAAAP